MYKNIFLLLLLMSPGLSLAAEIRVAVASNFSRAISAIAQQFEADTAHKVILIFGSTGKHYAQIKHGAPFDVFFAADVQRPQLLEQEGLIVPNSRFTYALGKLVLWSKQANYVDAAGEVLQTGQFKHLALANPKLAPYGKAAQQVLTQRNLWTSLQSRMVRGENIGQAFQFVNSGNAELGFIAYAQIKQPKQSIQASFWLVPPTLYSPIEQQAVLLTTLPAAREFLAFVRSAPMLQLIAAHGYELPNAQ